MSKKEIELKNHLYDQDKQHDQVLPIRRKSLICAYLWAFPLGLIGAHRFYLGQSLIGVAYLFSGGFFGLGWLYDLVFMSNLVEKVNDCRANPSSRKIYNLADAYILCLGPAGICFGLHQFYLGRKGFGTAYSFTCGMFGIGWLYDIFRMPKLVADANERAIELEKCPEAIHKKQIKHLDDAYLTWVLGILGAHHFYLGDTFFGIAYLCTFGMGGVGWLVDFFRMPILVKRANDENPSPEKKLDDAYILTFPFGMLGLQHFYLGRPLWGTIYSITFGLFSFGFLIDIIRMPYLVREVNEAMRERQNLLAVVIEEKNQSSNATGTLYQTESSTDIKKVPIDDNAASTQPPLNLYPSLQSMESKPTGLPPAYVPNC
ncbi:TM2 domain-containing protein [Trichoplax sp. H2]|nr:TM2 domain-containing protein [Trichoplax sp. H2]|eukprot:RDD45937.1 TM2 domain-containing protein [Trichoplax sp. H2]